MEPLKGIRVVETSTLLPAAFCSQLMAQLGADVIRVERTRPEEEFARANPPLFDCVNWNKRSLALNLRAPQGREALYRVVRTADVFIEAFRPEVKHRLGVDYETLRQHNPRLVYCSLSGFGSGGPYERRPGHDSTYLAVTGYLACTGDAESGPAQTVGIPVADMTGAHCALSAILSALLQRGRTGEGVWLDVALADAVLSVLTPRFGEYFGRGRPPANTFGIRAGMGVFRTADGHYISLGAVEDKFWASLCRALGREDLASGPDWATYPSRNARNLEANRLLAGEVARWQRDDLLRVMAQQDVPCEPVATLDAVWQDPHFRQRPGLLRSDPTRSPRVRIGFPVPAYAPATPDPPVPEPAPALGQHSDEILTEAGLTAGEIAALRAAEIVAGGA